MSETARLADTPEDFAHFGFNPAPEPWEYGMRTNCEPDSYEWWYTHLQLADESTLVTTFHTKPTHAVEGRSIRTSASYTTTQTVSISNANFRVSVDQFDAGKNGLWIELGDNRFTEPGTRLPNYLLEINDDIISVDVSLVAQMPAWQPVISPLVTPIISDG